MTCTKFIRVFIMFESYFPYPNSWSIILSIGFIMNINKLINMIKSLKLITGLLIWSNAEKRPPE